MDHRPPTLDMRLDGSFATPGRTGLSLSAKLMIAGALATLVAFSLAVAALAIWVFSMLLPVILLAALTTWATLTFRRSGSNKNKILSRWRARAATRTEEG